MVEITDRENAEVWFEQQPRRVRVRLSARSACRAFPFVWKLAESDDFKNVEFEFEDVVFSVVRCLLVSVAAAIPRIKLDPLMGSALSASSNSDQLSEEFVGGVSSVLFAASAAARSVALPELSSSASAYVIAHAASAASRSNSGPYLGDSELYNSEFRAFSRDVEAKILWPPLWPEDEDHQDVFEDWAVLTNKLSGDLETWGFWLSWYTGLLNGTPMDWSLTHKVALDLTDDDWDAGPEHVAKRISKIEAEYNASKLPQSETLRRDTSDNRFLVETVTQTADEIIAGVFRQLDFSLQMALKGGNASGFSDMCVAFQYLDHTRQNCLDDPNAVHMHIRLARECIEGKIRSGAYKSEDGLTTLLSALQQHEIQLRADHPEIRKAHDTFVAQKVREAEESLLLALADAFKSLRQDTKERLQQEFSLDADVISQGSSNDAQADAAKRSGGRAQRMALNLIEAGVFNEDRNADLTDRLQRVTELLREIL